MDPVEDVHGASERRAIRNQVGPLQILLLSVGNREDWVGSMLNTGEGDGQAAKHCSPGVSGHPHLLPASPWTSPTTVFQNQALWPAWPAAAGQVHGCGHRGIQLLVGTARTASAQTARPARGRPSSSSQVP